MNKMFQITVLNSQFSAKFTMDMKLDIPNGRSGSLHEVVPKNDSRSSMKRGSSSSISKPNMKSETIVHKCPAKESSSPIGPKFTKTPEHRRTSNTLKENLAPAPATDTAHAFPSPERTIKRSRLESGESEHREDRKREKKSFSNRVRGRDNAGTSRDGLKELTHSLINQQSESVKEKLKYKKIGKIDRRESCYIRDGKKGLPVSIELSRLKLRSRSISDFRGNLSVVNNIGTLRRCKSFNDRSSPTSSSFNVNINNGRIDDTRRRGQKRKCTSPEKHDSNR